LPVAVHVLRGAADAHRALGELRRRGAARRAGPECHPREPATLRWTEAMTEPVLSVSNLTVSFPSEQGRVSAVRGLSYEVGPGEALGIVGESGSGKSVSSLAIMGLLPQQANITGSIRFQGRELLGLSDVELSEIRGRRIGMIFQDPLSALTPVYT